jgi:NADPH-dependent 2,4-dienoyl-CoA reductase/sulfur reductase-like enzyme
MKFLIIGGDAAGMSAASRAKRLDPSISVTVLEQTHDVSYSACNMPYNVADPRRSMDDLVVRSADVFRTKQGIDVRTGHRAVGINPADRTVDVRTDQARELALTYDRLMIATGATPVMPDLPGFGLPGVMALKQLADGRALKAYLNENRVRHTVIIGMGYIALEMCEALHARGVEVEMVKPRPDLLPWMARDLAADIQEELEAHRIKLHLEKGIDQVQRDGKQLCVMGPDLSITTDMVLVAVGVRPNSELAAGAGLELGPSHAIAVDHRLQTSDRAIYSGGDCADAFHVVSGRRVWIPLALRANRAGWAEADHICGKPVHLPGIVGTAVFKVFDQQVARTGLTLSEAAEAGFDPQSVTITSGSRAHLYPGGFKVRVHMVGDKASGKLLGVQMVGKESVAHRVNAAAVALHGGMTVAQFVQCDLAYAPPFGGVWDPLLVAANQLIKKL